VGAFSTRHPQREGIPDSSMPRRGAGGASNAACRNRSARSRANQATQVLPSGDRRRSADDRSEPMPHGPNWEKAPAELADRFTATVSAMPGAQVRKMFGYPAGFVNGQMFIGIFASSWF